MRFNQNLSLKENCDRRRLTYDLLHAWTVFSGTSKKKIAVQRICWLIPTGFIIIRDKQHVIDFIKKYLIAMHWEAVATADASPDSDQDGNEVTFVIQKKLWLTTESLRVRVRE
ncbi:hypothetical protein RJT34_31415 [Clitoria ternatea]|uniref:Uncharacterized protein n=1 Tax=Clitoria ternatea TaxID=43366 RepID=A0AAN9EVJ6_CLITE